METAKLNPLEELVQLEKDQLRQSLEFIGQLKNVLSKPQDYLIDFELGWLGIKDEDK